MSSAGAAAERAGKRRRVDPPSPAGKGPADAEKADTTAPEVHVRPLAAVHAVDAGTSSDASRRQGALPVLEDATVESIATVTPASISGQHLISTSDVLTKVTQANTAAGCALHDADVRTEVTQAYTAAGCALHDADVRTKVTQANTAAGCALYEADGVLNTASQSHIKIKIKWRNIWI